ncbi:MAG TPA: hypothetical protein H9829_10265 [Candidatus Tetragenococcus pullicola]|nr:hypothetical protein [Candidatus Tetragenococcus pullicola]
MHYQQYKLLANIGIILVCILFLVSLFIFPDWRSFEKGVQWLAVFVALFNLFVTIKFKK